MKFRTFFEWVDVWNKIDQIYVKRQISPDDRNKYMANYLEALLMKASNYYYNTGKVIMDDTTFDNYLETLRLLRPESLILDLVGSKPKCDS